MRKLSTALLLVLMLMFLAVFAAIPVMAEDTGAKIWTDKADYSPGETVIIYGSGFNPGATVNITVTRPDATVDEWAVTSDSSGSFTTTYPLDGITGTYIVTATDGTNTATETFTVDPFTYSPSTHSATVSPGGSTSVATTIGIDPGGLVLTYPVTTDSWQFESVPSGWSVTPSPSPSYSWGGAGATVAVTLTVNVPAGASSGSYSFTAKLAPGKDSSTPKKTVGAGTGVAFTITVLAKYKVSFTQTGSAVAPTVDYYIDTGPTVTGTVPFDVLVDSGKQISYTYQATVPGTTGGVQYVLTTVSPASPQTVTGTLTILGTYKTQYYLTVKTDPLNVVSISGQGWYDKTTPATTKQLTAPSTVAVSDGVQYRFDYWDVDGVSQGLGTNPITVTMDNPHTATAHYVKQYEVKIGWSGLDVDASGKVVTVTVQGVDTVKNAGDSFFDVFVDEGKTVSYAYESLVSSTTDGKRYRFDSASGTSTDQSHNFGAIAGPITETGTYKIQYKLTLATDPSAVGVSHISASPSSSDGFYDINTGVTLTADSTVGIDATSRWRFDYWDVDGSSQGVGVNPITVTMGAAHTATAHYVKQYYLTLAKNPSDVATTPSGAGWYDVNAYASISTDEYVDIVAGSSRYRFDGWTTTYMTEITDPSAASTTVLMDKAKTVTANYVIQYKVTFDQTGVGGDFAGTVVTIDTTNNYGASQLPKPFWWDKDSTHTFAFASPLNVNGKRYVWTSTSGLSSSQSGSLTVTTYGSITGNYKTQFLLTVSVDPAAVGISNVNINPIGQLESSSTSSISYWYDSGTTVTLYTNPVNGYTFNYWSVDSTSKGAGVDLITVIMEDSAHDAIAYYVHFTMSGYFTDSDFNPIDSFDCVFTPGTGTKYKMSATNPGTYYYNLKIKNNGESGTFTIEVDIPSDFVLKPLVQGANPVQIDGKPVSYTISGSGNGLLTVSGVTINTGQTVKLTVHLDYARKFQYTGQAEFTASDQTTYHKGYLFPTKVNSVKGSAPTIVAAGKKVTAIGGFLFDSNGVPKGGLTVKVTDTLSTISDGDGFYFIVVPAGSYTVKVYNSLSTPIATSKPVSVAQDQYVSVDFKNLSPADPAIEGFVTDSNGTPIAGVTLQLIGASGRVIATTTTNAGGHYIFRFSAPGTYTVRIVVPDGYTATTTSVTLTIRQFETATVNFNLTKK